MGYTITITGKANMNPETVKRLVNDLKSVLRQLGNMDVHVNTQIEKPNANTR